MIHAWWAAAYWLAQAANSLGGRRYSEDMAGHLKVFEVSRMRPYIYTVHRTRSIATKQKDACLLHSPFSPVPLLLFCVSSVFPQRLLAVYFIVIISNIFPV